MTTTLPGLVRSRWLRLVFPLVLWGLATLYLGGDLGRWKDDYWLDFRDPVTGRADLTGLLNRQQFWRPIYFIVVPAVCAELGEHFRVVHVIGAVAHGAVCLLLWRFLRSCGLGGVAAGAGALVFLVYPGPWEVPLWPTAAPTGMAAGLFLCIGLIWIRALRGGPGRETRRLLIAAPAMALLAFVIACINEQPTAGIPALPLLSLALRRPDDAARRAVARSVVPAGVCALAVTAYLGLYFGTAAPGARGTAGTFVTDLSALHAKWTVFAEQFRVFFLFQGFGAGSLILGWRTIRDSMPAGGLWLGALVLSVIPWAIPAASPDSPDPKDRGNRNRACLWLGAFGAAVFLLGWLPVLAIADQPIESRLCYVPMMGLAIALSAGVDWVWGLGLPVWGRRAGVAVFVALLMVGAVMDLGVQAALRARSRADDLQAAQLRGLLPAPAPGSIFIPLRLSDNNTRTGMMYFDTYFSGALERSWSSPKYLRRAYARKDIQVGWWNRYAAGAFVLGGDRRGLRFDERGVGASDQLRLKFPQDETGAMLIPWGRAVPFLVDGEGSVRLVSAVVVFDRAGRRTVFPVAQASRALEAQRIPGTWAVYRDGADATRFEIQQAPVPGRPPP